MLESKTRLHGLISRSLLFNSFVCPTSNSFVVVSRGTPIATVTEPPSISAYERSWSVRRQSEEQRAVMHAGLSRAR